MRAIFPWFTYNHKAVQAYALSVVCFGGHCIIVAVRTLLLNITTAQESRIEHQTGVSGCSTSRRTQRTHNGEAPPQTTKTKHHQHLASKLSTLVLRDTHTSGSWSMSAAVPMECADAPMAIPRGTRLSLPTPIASRTAVPTEAPYTPVGQKQSTRKVEGIGGGGQVNSLRSYN